MKRRTLFAKLGAVAAAAAVAPMAGKPEPVEAARSWNHANLYTRPTGIVEPAESTIGFYGRFPEDTSVWSFERMQNDCAVRGCKLLRQPHEQGGGFMYVHSCEEPRHQIMVVIDDSSSNLQMIDDWRTSLHNGERLGVEITPA